ncbi:uncharacterized protein EI90DRAFT_3125086 [Cantharellus anzutake]|uniref:uncharacterized protein n=1 Tax=Cantharellus anzutake TaxID=1750568 RepID=UPI001904E18A|nr:uncharacterized protein EI90DRAFT_3125086 [Cantharellus anzutake]KAF8329829.1 hypothetical protein EI90DRAFT_3125086 [Cantharellus anzutake]
MPQDEGMEDVQYSSTSLGKRRPILRDDQIETVFQSSEDSRPLWVAYLEKAEGKADHEAWSKLIRSVLSTLSQGLNEAGVKVVSRSERASIMENFGDVERRKCQDLITDALRQSKWHPLIRYVDVKLRLAEPGVPSQTGDELPPWASHVDTEIIQEAIHSSWNTNYELNYHKLLLNNILAMSRTQSYSSTVSIIQSSGYGKSRMVDQLATLVFTLPFNLRDPLETRDPSVRQLLTKSFNPPQSDISDAEERELTVRYYLFFRHLFDSVGKRIKAELKDTTNLPCAWRRYLASSTSEGVTRREELYKEVVSQVEMDSSLAEIRADPKSGVGAKLLKSVKVACDKLVRLFPLEDQGSVPDSEAVDEKPGIRVFLYFDEAHSLTDPWIPHRSRYDKMLSCLEDLRTREIPVFTIFLTTSSHFENLAPAPGPRRSARMTSEDSLLQAPIMELPFDCFRKAPVIKDFDSLSSAEVLSCCGRPLWWTMYDAFKQNDKLHNNIFAKKLMDLARAKLAGLEGATGDLTKYTQEAKLAVIDMRLQLDYEPARQVAATALAQMVASHMRTVFSIPTHRDYMRSGYPSEPWLAEAAAQEMENLHSLQPDFIFKTLEEVMNQGIIDIGERGEVIARAMIMRAYDRAVGKSRLPPYTSDDKFIKFSRGCRLIDFIGCLFSAGAAQDVLASLPITGGTVNLGEQFENARIRFTHFARLHSEDVVSTAGCIAGIVRCAAFVTQRGQPSIDMMIPIVLNPHKTQPDLLRRENVTAMFIQIKNRRTAGNTAGYNIDARNLSFFSGGDQPYITLVMELGVLPTELIQQEKKMKKGAPSFRPAEPPTPSRLMTTKEQLRKSPRAKPVEHECYNIFAYGCSATVYNMQPGEVQCYSTLLRKGGLFVEHPRWDDKSLDALRCLVPFLSIRNCEEWLEKLGVMIDGDGVTERGFTIDEMARTVLLGVNDM